MDLLSDRCPQSVWNCGNSHILWPCLLHHSQDCRSHISSQCTRLSYLLEEGLNCLLPWKLGCLFQAPILDVFSVRLNISPCFHHSLCQITGTQLVEPAIGGELPATWFDIVSCVPKYLMRR